MFLLNKIIIGVMSGSSLDGLDIGAFTFENRKSNWNYKILKFKTFEIPNELKKNLSNSDKLSKILLNNLDKNYGEFIGLKILEFISDLNTLPSLLGVHGHTVFHEPKKGFSLQIGSSVEISKLTQIPTISNFRNEDIINGGQGAPLVPIGDELLFSEFDICVNLGGIANITDKKRKIAFDLCYCNRALNFLSQKLNKPYDLGGKIAETGELNIDFLNQLQALKYLKKEPPKSLNNQDFSKDIIPLIKLFEKEKPKSLLNSYVVFLAEEISKYLGKTNKVLISGGGALNDFLIKSIKERSPSSITVPEKVIIEGKEALIFAFMALLKFEKKINVLSSYTGSYRDSSSGEIQNP